MQKIVDCKLVINSVINNKTDSFIAEGRGYYKNDNNEITIYFNSDNIKYKYIYNNDQLIINCNDSWYEFFINKEGIGKIKNGDYIFEVTTLTSKIEVNNNLIILDYTLLQQGVIIGKYMSQLSFQ